MAPQLSEDEIDDLLYAARTGDNDELTTLLSSLAEREKVSPADILTSAKDEGKSTCLHMATGNGHLETVHLLLTHLTPANTPTSTAQKQAYLDAPNAYGNTGLHWAALGGHLSVVRALVEAGASVAAANDKNYIPLDVAGFAEKGAVVDYFLERAEELERSDKGGGGVEGGLVKGVEGVSVEDGEGDGEEEVVVMRAGEGVGEDGVEGKGKGKGEGEDVKEVKA
ncbi:ankyrin-repeat-containing protein [Chaetomium tenue]|uniref:Ankyrin-repeat-containing protein n=1 Tax=Chaetomium tenue TaxID=1854479 RepID=A0ACB7PIY8_9PEZI|nr:ankyrin-repeat-containing protein [Chaetomium globosum]